MSDSCREWLALLSAPGIGAASAVRLANGLGGPAAVLGAGRAELLACGVGADALRALRAPDWARVDDWLEWARRSGCAVLALSDPRYPAPLAAIADPPPVLFVRGEPDSLSAPQLAVVGSRNPTASGAETAEAFARALAAHGLAITSGLAHGIDAAAHRGALAAGGLTVAVAGHGLDQCYPSRNAALADAIVRSGGAMVSEFVPGTPPLRDNFPRRNRVISGLALGVLVVEAAVRSGSLITARLGAEQGREVFAVPGSIHNPMARGCHRLIRQGAKLVETTEDLLEELRGAAPVAHGPDDREASASQDSKTAVLDREYEALLDVLGHDPASVDVLVARTGLTPQVLSSMLLKLELEGIVQAVPGAGYARAAKRN